MRGLSDLSATCTRKARSYAAVTLASGRYSEQTQRGEGFLRDLTRCIDPRAPGTLRDAPQLGAPGV
jgi:hypothetical protein